MVMQKRLGAPGDLDLVRRFVNTLEIDTATDELATPGQLRAWLAEEGLASPRTRVTRAGVDRATSVREALRKILLAHNDGSYAPHGAWRTLDHAACRAGVGLRFEHGGASVRPSAGGVDGALGKL